MHRAREFVVLYEPLGRRAPRPALHVGASSASEASAQQGIGDPSIFSGSISKALITTVVGLIVAIPSYASYLYFSKKVEDMVAEMDNYATILTTRIYGEKNV